MRQPLLLLLLRLVERQMLTPTQVRCLQATHWQGTCLAHSQTKLPTKNIALPHLAEPPYCQCCDHHLIRKVLCVLEGHLKPVDQSQLCHVQGGVVAL